VFERWRTLVRDRSTGCDRVAVPDVSGVSRSIRLLDRRAVTARNGSSDALGALRATRTPQDRLPIISLWRLEATDNEASPSLQKTRASAKSILRLPDLEIAKSAVLNSLSCPDAQRGYRHAIDEFVEWYCSEPRLSFSKTVVVRYRMYLESRGLAPGTINLRLGAVRHLAYEAADCGLLSADLAAGIRRVRGVKKLGVRLGNWLAAQQAQALWQAPDRAGIKGKRGMNPKNETAS
jgi:hypothetical protein